MENPNKDKVLKVPKDILQTQMCLELLRSIKIRSNRFFKTPAPLKLVDHFRLCASFP